jgi:hypothetical protein
MKGFEDVSDWLNAFHDHYPSHWKNDGLATTYACTAAVLLAACRLDTASAALIAGVTGLPKSFVYLIVQRMDRSQYRSAEAFLELERTIRDRNQDFSAIEDAREYAIDVFWEESLSLDDVARLMDARGSRILGGGYQDWVDEEEVDNFMQGIENEGYTAE